MTDSAPVNKRMDEETDLGSRGCKQTVDRRRSNGTCWSTSNRKRYPDEGAD